MKVTLKDEGKELVARYGLEIRIQKDSYEACQSDAERRLFFLSCAGSALRRANHAIDSESKEGIEIA